MEGMTGLNPPASKALNWPEHDKARKRRRSLTIRFDPEMAWAAQPTGKRGQQPVCRDAGTASPTIPKPSPKSPRASGHRPVERAVGVIPCLWMLFSRPPTRPYRPPWQRRRPGLRKIVTKTSEIR